MTYRIRDKKGKKMDGGYGGVRVIPLPTIGGGGTSHNNKAPAPTNSPNAIVIPFIIKKLRLDCAISGMPA